MITTTVLTGEEKQQGGLELAQQWRQSPQGMMWLDIQSETYSDDVITGILKQMGCHSLAITDVLRKRHPPKLEVFKDHIFILYRGVTEVLSTLEFRHLQMAFFIGENYLITVHPKPSLGLGKVLAQVDTAFTKFSPLGMSLKVIHSSASVYLEQVLSFESELGEMEETLYSEKSEAVLVDLAKSKASLIKLKRTFKYHRDMFQELKSRSAETLPFDTQKLEHQLIDVAERLERLNSLAQMNYDICGDMMEGYISITSHQMNITMRLLTVVTVVFVPLTFMAGIYGMNFQFMPELGLKYAYPALIGLMLIITLLLVWIFKRKKWF